MVRAVMWVFAVLFVASLGFQGWQLYKFMNAGARFTAKDGQELCERVRFLEQQSGRIAASCPYYQGPAR